MSARTMRKQALMHTDQMKLAFSADLNNQSILDAMLQAIPGIAFITNASGCITRQLSPVDKLPVYNSRLYSILSDPNQIGLQPLRQSHHSKVG